MIETRAHEVARQMREYIRASHERFLPSIRVLARKCGVGTGCMHQAIHILANEGLVLCRHGSRIRIAANVSPEVSESAGKAAYELADKIRGEIISGRLQKGDGLPKIEYYTQQYHISRETVSAALKILADENLIHKMGRRWVVGAEERERDAVHIHPIEQKPTVLLVFPNHDIWLNTVISALSQYFQLIQILIRELQRKGFAVVPAYTDEHETDPWVPSGKDGVHQLVQKLGERFRGAVLISLHYDVDGEWWAKWFISQRRPLVTFHRYFPSIAQGGLGRYYAHCDYNVAGVVRCAIEAVAYYGHRCIAVPFSCRNGVEDDWVRDRLEITRKICAALHPPIEVAAVAQQDEDFWYFDKWRKNENAFVAYFDSLISRNIPGPKPDKTSVVSNTILIRTAMRACSPSLASILDHPRVTAVMTPNDRLARFYLLWFQRMGIQFPRDFSLIGFDNDIHSLHLPISTVDFGLGELGYLAARFIIGDLPVGVNRNRKMIGRCELVDRGSLGPPANR